MKREIPVETVIRELQQLPPSAKIIVDTQAEVKIIGVITACKDGGKQIAEFVVPKAED
jgi:hypothetical protein